MSYTTTLNYLSSAVIDSVADMVAIVLEQTHDIRELFCQLVGNNTLSIAEDELLYAKDTSSPTLHTIPRKRLPPTLSYMSELRKSVIRTAYSRDMHTFRPGSSQLPRAQRSLAAPIALSGPDAAVNVALRPMAAHISLGHEHQPTAAPCPTPVLSKYINPQADILATLRGATRVLDALVRGSMDEKWLEAPGDEPEPISAPRMTRSYAQWSPIESTKTTRSYARAGKAHATGSPQSDSFEHTPKGSTFGDLGLREAKD